MGDDNFTLSDSLNKTYPVLMIRLVALEDLENVSSLFVAAISMMNNNGILQWDAIYPDKEILRDDIHQGQMFGHYQNDQLAGVMVLNTIPLEKYAEISWSVPDEKPLIIHRLCVHPSFQRRGVATQLVQFAERYAIASGYQSIRLDAFLNNPYALQLYTRIGYQDRGIIQLRKGPFVCFEKVLAKYD